MLKKNYLCAVAQENAGKTGQLNPDWVEVLMGWPPGWTSLDPLPREVWDMWEENFYSWWPAHRPFTVWHCLNIIYPSLTTENKNRSNRLKAIGNGQVPHSFIEAMHSIGDDY